MAWLGGTTTVAAEGDITGAVTGPNGPEAGVWVIAETDDLETHFIKIVVTDDDGRFLLPELPAAGYRVWVRGYGLQASTAVEAEPAADLTLRAAAPATPQAAAAIYPANYWYGCRSEIDAHQAALRGWKGKTLSTGVTSVR